jgi:hypothetical protein
MPCAADNQKRSGEAQLIDATTHKYPPPEVLGSDDGEDKIGEFPGACGAMTPEPDVGMSAHCRGHDGHWRRRGDVSRALAGEDALAVRGG